MEAIYGAVHNFNKQVNLIKCSFIKLNLENTDDNEKQQYTVYQTYKTKETVIKHYKNILKCFICWCSSVVISVG